MHARCFVVICEVLRFRLFFFFLSYCGVVVALVFKKKHHQICDFYQYINAVS